MSDVLKVMVWIGALEIIDRDGGSGRCKAVHGGSCGYDHIGAFCCPAQKLSDIVDNAGTHRHDPVAPGIKMHQRGADRLLIGLGTLREHIPPKGDPCFFQNRPHPSSGGPLRIPVRQKKYLPAAVAVQNLRKPVYGTLLNDYIVQLYRMGLAAGALDVPVAIHIGFHKITHGQSPVSSS